MGYSHKLVFGTNVSSGYQIKVKAILIEVMKQAHKLVTCSYLDPEYLLIFRS